MRKTAACVSVFTGKVTSMTRLNNSPMGNPAWALTLENFETGQILFGRTAPNAQLGYLLTSNKNGTTLKLEYHFTKGGRCYFDRLVS